jgi:putative protein kinase ArgK-like GTPase of G3E family
MSGWGSEVSLFNSAVMLLAAIAVIVNKYGWPWQWGKKKKNNHRIQTQKINPHGLQSLPGVATVCVQNRDNINKVLTKIEDMEKLMERNCDQNEKDHEQMWTRINQLSDRM